MYVVNLKKIIFTVNNRENVHRDFLLYLSLQFILINYILPYGNVRMHVTVAHAFKYDVTVVVMIKW